MVEVIVVVSFVWFVSYHITCDVQNVHPSQRRHNLWTDRATH